MRGQWTLGFWFCVLRIYAGCFWLAHGVPKFLHSATFMPPNGFIVQAAQHAASSQSGWYHVFLAGTVLPNIHVFAELVRLGEVLTGCSLLLGIFTRAGGAVGCFLLLNYMAVNGEFASWTTLGSVEAAGFMLSLTFVLVPAGRIFGADALLLRTRSQQAASAEPRVIPEIVDEGPQTPV